MKKNGQNSTYKKTTIVTIAISLLVLLFLLYLPRINSPPRPGISVKQRAQLHSISACLELFKLENNGYPPSTALDLVGQPYCGAMKLCEAMMGQDLLGFHPDSVFRSDGMDATNTEKLYTSEPNNLKARMGPYLPPDIANVYRLKEIYEDVGPFDGNSYVICDVYTRERHSGKKIGMPILYYKADTSKKLHDPNTAPTPTDSMGNIYNYWDNHALVNLGKPGKTSTHNLANPARFYRNTRNDKTLTERRPYRPDSYILISAGYDGEYGTADDICNFDWKYRE